MHILFEINSGALTELLTDGYKGIIQAMSPNVKIDIILRESFCGISGSLCLMIEITSVINLRHNFGQ